MTLKPLKGYVITKPITRENKTKSGLDLPDIMEKDVSLETEVVAIGRPNDPDFEKTASGGVSRDFNVGDIALYRPFSGVKHGEYLILRFEDLIAIKTN